MQIPVFLRAAMSHAHMNKGTTFLSSLKEGGALIHVHTANAAAVRVRRTRNCRHGSLCLPAAHLSFSPLMFYNIESA